MDATAVAITSVVIAGVGGPSITAWATTRGQRRRFATEERVRDTEELRDRLDDVAGSLDAANRVLGPVYGTITQQGATAQALQGRVADGFRMAADAEFAVARLAIRLEPDHPAVRHADDALRAIRRVVILVDDNRALRRPLDTETHESIQANQQTAVDALGEFLNAARRLVGTASRVPSVDAGRTAG
jgi:hypothetical protein